MKVDWFDCRRFDIEPHLHVREEQVDVSEPSPVLTSTDFFVSLDAEVIRYSQCPHSRLAGLDGRKIRLPVALKLVGQSRSRCMQVRVPAVPHRSTLVPAHAMDCTIRRVSELEEVFRSDSGLNCWPDDPEIVGVRSTRLEG